MLIHSFVRLCVRACVHHFLGPAHALGAGQVRCPLIHSFFYSCIQLCVRSAMFCLFACGFICLFFAQNTCHPLSGAYSQVLPTSS